MREKRTNELALFLAAVSASVAFGLATHNLFIGAGVMSAFCFFRFLEDPDL